MRVAGPPAYDSVASSALGDGWSRSPALACVPRKFAVGGDTGLVTFAGQVANSELLVIVSQISRTLNTHAVTGYPVINGSIMTNSSYPSASYARFNTYPQNNMMTPVAVGERVAIYVISPLKSTVIIGQNRSGLYM